MTGEVYGLKRCAKLKVVVLGPDGAGKSTVIRGLSSWLEQQGIFVKVRHLKPNVAKLGFGKPVTIVVDPHGKPPRSTLLSIAKIVVWLLEEWLASFIEGRKETLLLYDRYYHDLLVDPLRYRYGGPTWAAILIGKLMPKPDLWVLLDAPANVLQARKSEVSLKETARQRDAYLAFARSQKSFAIVDASQPLDKVVTDAERAITKMSLLTR